MKNLLKKELALTASPLSYWFLGFFLLTFTPGYPILVGGFFLCLGLFQSFQVGREANDVTYTALLPVKKTDVVRAKFAFCLAIEGAYFVLTSVATLLRMTVLADVTAYRQNALMTANLCYLGFLLLVFGLFNAVFVGGFFKTAYKFAKPFIAFAVAAFITVGIAETLIHIPGLSALNAFGFTHIGVQVGVLLGGALAFAVLTGCAMKTAMRNFEKIDL